MNSQVLVHRAVQDQSLEAVQEPRFYFANGQIWSAMGGVAHSSLGPQGAESQLLDLRRIALDASEPGYWRFACKRYARQLDTALEQYRAHWAKELERA